MCLIIFAWRPAHARPLVVAANRDEFYARPTQALAPWADAPGVHAGRDLEAGGTWLGIGPGGRFAAVTNIRGGAAGPGRRSRGELCATYLAGKQSLDEFARQVCARAADYAGFNLLLSDGRQLYYLNSYSATPEALGEGIYGLSNAALNTPWPKLRKARKACTPRLDDNPAGLFDVLADSTPASDAELPDTGVGLATERLLSSVFIASATYGTRVSTVLVAHADGRREVIERSFGPGGGHLGEVRFTVQE
ncbi:NRDE family protein [Pseudomonas sp. RIT-PI-S]|uniref:NRDE family protein n=1 Tax=Pseudomonas sp. RIT-PI-S TaxID=3035295 RepID=UPI0021DAFDEF|nr:NRDE family protein [Pseudomonas sp. RIT-PI-S]